MAKGIEIKDLGKAEGINDADTLLVQQEGTTRQIDYEMMRKAALEKGIEENRLVDEERLQTVNQEVESIKEMLPSTASETNKLVSKSYVDESIQTSTAVNRGSFETYADLIAYSGTVTRNDYAYVADNETHDHEAWRYKWNDNTHEWTAEYRINEAPMTLEQLAALNSGITAEILQRLLGATETPVGTVSLYMGIVAPIGYLMCDKTYSADDYPALWAVLPDNLKNIEERTFDIDFRELVPVGAGQSSRTDIATHDVYQVGQFKDDQFQGHSHNLTNNCSDYSSFVDGDTGFVISKQDGKSPKQNPITSPKSYSNYGKVRIGTTTHGKQIGVNYIIKY